MNLTVFKALASLTRRPRGSTQAERMNAFYGSIAEDYDQLREVLLPGRRDLVELLEPSPGARIAEFGAGSGWTTACFGSRMSGFSNVDLVDCCSPLLAIANRRIQQEGWKNVHIHEADATDWQAPERSLDVVFFSYSLSMMPRWTEALNNALRLLKPGGKLGVVDFYISTATPLDGYRRHSAWCRWFWPRVFAKDNIWLRPELLPALESCTNPLHRRELIDRMPIVGFKRPYLIYVGQKPE